MIEQDKKYISTQYNANEAHYKVFFNAFLGGMGLALLNLIIGFLGYSTIIINSGFFFAMNMILSALMFLGVRINEYGFDDKYPFGIGKLFFIVLGVGSVFISLTVGVIIFISYEALASQLITSVDTVAMIALIITIIANEILFKYILSEGKRLKDERMVSHAWEIRIGSAVAFLAIIVILIRQLLTYQGAGYIGSIFIALLIFIDCIRVLRKAIDGLMDYFSISNDKVMRVLRTIPKIMEILQIKTRTIGYEACELSVDILVDPGMTIKDTDQLRNKIREEIMKHLPSIKLILIDFR